MVKKKAALTLLRLYRKHPDVIPAAEWAMRIVAIMDDMDLVRFYNHNANYSNPRLGRSELCHEPRHGNGTRPP